MSLWDIILIILIAAAVILAILSIRRNKKRGKSCSCGGDCSRCAGCGSADCNRRPKG